MNVNIKLLSLGALSLLFSCSQFKVSETEEGDRIQMHKEGSGKPIEEGDMLELNMKISTELDTVFRNTWEEGKPMTVPARKGEFRGSFENAIFQLSEGDSATVYVSADSLFSRIGQPLPPGVPEHSDLKFLVSVKSAKTLAEYEESLNSKRSGEADEIAAFVKEKYPKAQKMENGIYYLTDKEGSGAVVAAGDTATVSYIGKFFDGNIFDQNKTFTFPVGLGYVIKGWDEALKTMNVGQKATFIVPSGLAYGERGAGATIPPFTPLVFDIELFSIGRK